MQQLGVQEGFWGVAQRPRQPLYCGTRESSVVFGIPGIPLAVMICFYEYVRPVLLKLMGYGENEWRLQTQWAELAAATAAVAQTVKAKGRRRNL